MNVNGMIVGVFIGLAVAEGTILGTLYVVWNGKSPGWYPGVAMLVGLVCGWGGAWIGSRA